MAYLADYTNEEWRAISEAPDYEVSSLSRVRRRRPDRCNRPIRILSQATKVFGHKQVSLCIDGKIVSRMVHRLVAIAFIGPQPDELPFVCHIDGDPANNAPSNLYWGDAKTNGADSIAHGTVQTGEKNVNAKLNPDIVRSIRADQRSSTVAAPEYGISVSTYCRIKSGRLWRHVI